MAGRARRSPHPVRSRLAPAAARGLAALCRQLGWREAQALGRGIGRLGWWLGWRDRARTLEHLALALPEIGTEDRHRLARRVFEHFGVLLGECLHLSDKSCAEIARHVEVEGWERVEALRAAGRQVLVVTGHCGNWELLAATINCRGLGMAVVARQLEDLRFDALLLALRERFGTRTIQRGRPGAARELLRAVRGGAALGLLIDQDTAVEGVWVPFFGRTAFTPSGAADLALRFGLAAVPAFIERRSDGSHLARFEPPIDLPADPVAATARMTERIEAQVRRRPEQWPWFHRRWRRRPPEPSA
jgi:KDO2-lipid IV(A) lauroyltransferase